MQSDEEEDTAMVTSTTPPPHDVVNMEIDEEKHNCVIEDVICNRQHEKRMLHWLRTSGEKNNAPITADGVIGEPYVTNATPQDQLVKIALSLFKVQQNIYLLDFQRIEVRFDICVNYSRSLHLVLIPSLLCICM